MNTINSLLTNDVINQEQAMELVTTLILYYYTGDLIDCLEHDGSIPNEDQYVRMYCNWTAEHKIESQISDPFTIFLSRAMRDTKNLFIIARHPLRTCSASLMLKYSNITYGFGFAFQVVTLTNDERKRSKVMSDFLEDKNALCTIVKHLEGLEDAEMSILNRLDSNLEKLLNNNGHAIEIM